MARGLRECVVPNFYVRATRHAYRSRSGEIYSYHIARTPINKHFYVIIVGNPSNCLSLLLPHKRPVTCVDDKVQPTLFGSHVYVYLVFQFGKTHHRGLAFLGQ